MLVLQGYTITEHQMLKLLLLSHACLTDAQSLRITKLSYLARENSQASCYKAVPLFTWMIQAKTASATLPVQVDRPCAVPA